mmetsp:Transcript_4088/g.16756  ORF Transcript_4088/g.16756 Transcript_4088/m.16756 type:complete len:226 (-) Transcript_4088:205-882(-)
MCRRRSFDRARAFPRYDYSRRKTNLGRPPRRPTFLPRKFVGRSPLLSALLQTPARPAFFSSFASSSTLEPRPTSSSFKSRPLYSPDRLLDVLGHPAEPLAVPHALDDGAHEHLDRPHVGRLQVDLPLARGVVGQAEAVAELLFARRVRDVDLVAQDQERHLPEGIIGQQRVQLLLALGEALLVNRVDEEHDGVNLGVVILPNPASHLVPAQVESLELDLPDGQLL